MAEQLFSDGKALMEAGKIDAACPKLQESYRLDKGGGALLLLGICHESQGLFATAWGELRGALAAAKHANRLDRIAVAQAHLAQVAPRVPHVAIVVPAADTTPALDVRLDGVSLKAASYGVALPVDPGQHDVEASAPGKIGWKTTMNIAPGQADANVVVPPLQPSVESARTAAPSGRGESIAIASGAAVVWLGLSAFWGIRALSAENRKPVACQSTDFRCVSNSRDDENERNRMAAWSTVAGAIGGAAAGTAVFLWITRPSSAAAPLTTPSACGLLVRGSF
jgi:hypothetical protein